MNRKPVLTLSLLALLFAHEAARAHHIKIELEVRVPKANKTAHEETAGVGSIAKTRLVLEATPSDRVAIRWKVTSTAPKDTIKNLLIHFVAVKEEQPNQRAVPKLDKDVAAETACTLDFKPGDSAHGELQLRFPQPGVYLIRLETIGAAIALDGHEHFAALDLLVR